MLTPIQEPTLSLKEERAAWNVPVAIRYNDLLLLVCGELIFSRDLWLYIDTPKPTKDVI